MTQPLPSLLIDPVTAHRVRIAISQALRAGSTVREARSEGRGYLKAVCPALPQAHVAEAVDEVLADLDPMMGDLIHCESDARVEPSGQLRLGL